MPTLAQQPGEDFAVDASSALQRVFDTAPAGSNISIPAGKYRILSTVRLSKELHIAATGAEFSIGADINPFRFEAQPTFVTPLIRDYRIGDREAQIGAVDRPPEPGTWVRVVSDAVDPGGRDEGNLRRVGRVGEWAQIAEGSSETVLRFQSPLRFARAVNPASQPGDEPWTPAYTLAMRARVVGAPRTTMSWTGGSFAFDAGHDDWSAAMFSLTGFFQPVLDGVEITKGYGSGIAIQGAFRPTIRNCRISNLSNDKGKRQFGYGVADGSYSSLVENCRFSNVRHGYTTVGTATRPRVTDPLTLLSVGRVVGARVTGCVGVGGEAPVFDTHQSAEDVVFSDCMAQDCRSFGFHLRGRNIRLERPILKNCALGIAVVTEYAGQPPQEEDDFFTNAKPEGLSYATIDGGEIDVEQDPITARFARRVSVTGALRSASRTCRMVQNTGSFVRLACAWNHTSTSRPISLAPSPQKGPQAIFETRRNDVRLHADYSAALVIETPCDIRVDSAAGDDQGARYAVFWADDPESKVDVRGKVSLRLSDAFQALCAGPPASYAGSLSGAVRWSRSGRAQAPLDIGIPRCLFALSDERSSLGRPGLNPGGVVSLGTRPAWAEGLAETLRLKLKPPADGPCCLRFMSTWKLECASGRQAILRLHLVDSLGQRRASYAFAAFDDIALEVQLVIEASGRASKELREQVETENGAGRIFISSGDAGAGLVWLLTSQANDPRDRVGLMSHSLERYGLD